MNNLDILMIGGSGFLSAACARLLVAAGHRVTVLSRGQRPLVPGTTGLRGDRGETPSLHTALAGFRADVTIDFLAFGQAEVSQLLEVPGFSPGRYLLISTGQVYLVAQEPRPPHREEDIGLPAMPEPPFGSRDHDQWVYGMGKRAAEAELLSRRTRGLDAVSLRVPVVLGAGDPSRRLWAYLQRMLDSGPILLPEGGLEPVRFVWVEDVARAVLTLACLPSIPSDAYNLAMPDEPSLRAFLDALAHVAGYEPNYQTCSMSQLVAAGLDHQVSTYSGTWCSRPDPERAKRELGLLATPSSGWLPSVVAAHLAEKDPASHPGYAHRAAELSLAARLSS